MLTAMDRYPDDLVFGDDVNIGIRRLVPDAGPPTKILHYLSQLAELARAKRDGALGTRTVKWLESRGVVGSIESDTVRRSPKDRAARTWDDGNSGKRAFDLHLKPSDATSPDRCVRIYCEYDQASQKVIVGWVGPHPE